MSGKLTQSMMNIFRRARRVGGQSGATRIFPSRCVFCPVRPGHAFIAIYGFARLTDDIGDEAEGDRLALLTGSTTSSTLAGEGRAIHPVFQRLTPMIEISDSVRSPFAI